VHDHVITLIWDVWNRGGFRSDVVITTRERGFTEAVAKLFDQQCPVVSYVYRMEPHVLGRRAAASPDVHKIFYGLDSQQFVYGAKGYHIPFGGTGFQPLLV
jgi:hypothetical protein